jgi:hypothetical protein
VTPAARYPEVDLRCEPDEVVESRCSREQLPCAPVVDFEETRAGEVPFERRTGMVRATFDRETTDRANSGAGYSDGHPVDACCHSVCTPLAVKASGRESGRVVGRQWYGRVACIDPPRFGTRVPAAAPFAPCPAAVSMKSPSGGAEAIALDRVSSRCVLTDEMRRYVVDPCESVVVPAIVLACCYSQPIPP